MCFQPSDSTAANTEMILTAAQTVGNAHPHPHSHRFLQVSSEAKKLRKTSSKASIFRLTFCCHLNSERASTFCYYLN